jgi:hypothetical protein
MTVKMGKNLSERGLRNSRFHKIHSNKPVAGSHVRRLLDVPSRARNRHLKAIQQSSNLNNNNFDWDEIIAKTPVEKVVFDKNGHYDAKKSPNFDDWMKNG